MENTKPCSTREPEAMFCIGQPLGWFHSWQMQAILNAGRYIRGARMFS
jgi:hypothetical protein